MAQRFCMRLKIKNNWTIITLLLIVNLGLISSILLFHSKDKTGRSCEECSQSKKSFNADALNSITIKLM